MNRANFVCYGVAHIYGADNNAVKYGQQIHFGIAIIPKLDKVRTIIALIYIWQFGVINIVFHNPHQSVFMSHTYTIQLIR